MRIAMLFAVPPRTQTPEKAKPLTRMRSGSTRTFVHTIIDYKSVCSHIVKCVQNDNGDASLWFARTTQSIHQLRSTKEWGKNTTKQRHSLTSIIYTANAMTGKTGYV